MLNIIVLYRGVCFKALRNPIWEESCCTMTCRTLEPLCLSLSLFFSYSALSLSLSLAQFKAHTTFYLHTFIGFLHFFSFWGHLRARGFVWEKKVEIDGIMN